MICFVVEKTKVWKDLFDANRSISLSLKTHLRPYVFSKKRFILSPESPNLLFFRVSEKVYQKKIRLWIRTSKFYLTYSSLICEEGTFVNPNLRHFY